MLRLLTNDRLLNQEVPASRRLTTDHHWTTISQLFEVSLQKQEEQLDNPLSSWSSGFPKIFRINFMFPFISHSGGLDEKPSFWIAVERINFLRGNEAAPITELLSTPMIITSLSICWSEYNDWLGNKNGNLMKTSRARIILIEKHF